MERQWKQWFGILVLALFAPPGAFAQGTAAVKGLVKDSSGGSIPGAVVRVVNESGATTEAVTDGEGPSTRRRWLPAPIAWKRRSTASKPPSGA